MNTALHSHPFRTAPRSAIRALVSWALLVLVFGSALAVAPITRADTRMSATHQPTNEVVIDAPTVEVTSALDMRDDEYNSDYIFGMTRGVADSTIIPAVKPLFFIVTIPLDIVLLPFAAIGGFF